MLNRENKLEASSPKETKTKKKAHEKDGEIKRNL